MLYSLYKTLQIDVYYSVNSIIYTLVKIPGLNNLLGEDPYDSKIIKTIIGLFGSILSFGRGFLYKVIYFFVLFSLCKNLFTDFYYEAFYHVFFFLTILGLFINNKLLTTSKKKYFSIILLQMDGNKFLRANFIWNLLLICIFNEVCLLLLNSIYNVPISCCLILLLLTIVCRIVGEALNIAFYRKYKYVWYSNTKIYFPVFFILLGLSLLPFIGICIPISIIFYFSIILLVFSVVSIRYIFSIDDFKLIYKSLTNMSDVMNEKNQSTYYRQALVNMKDKDKTINSRKLNNKHGYDLFNTIFFERHKTILLESARNYAVIAAIVYITLGYFMLNDLDFNISVGNFLLLKLSWFVLIMYFMNRGAVVTQAMFFNCDHAMLTYNFYRDPDTIVGLFKRRLLNITLINMIPAFVIGIGNCCLLYLSSINCSITTYVTSFLFIISLSIFFSVHYLVIYYLMQPYNKNMQMKKMSYSVVSLITYIITFQFTDLIIGSYMLSVFGILFVIIYIIIALILVKKFAPMTFKLY